LLAFFAQLCKDKDFMTISYCFFEAYHGKSLVDGMFGVLSNWMKEWTKTKYINTTNDLLECFKTFNLFNNNKDRNFFISRSFSPTLWTRLSHEEMKGLKSLKNINYFHFNYNTPKAFTTYSLVFQVNTRTQEIEYKELKQTALKVATKTIKKQTQPKFSKQLESVNSINLTSSDNLFLQKKAKSWGLTYAP